MNKPVVVNFFGGPGAGKSSLAHLLFWELKKRRVNCEMAREYAKDLTWEGRDKALDNQFYVAAKQWFRQDRLEGEVDVIITDSPILLSLYYENYSGEKKEAYHDFITELYKEQRNVNFFITRVKEYQEAGRNQTAEEAREVSKEVQKMLKDKSIDFTSHPGDESAMDEIVSEVLGELYQEEKV